MKDLRNQVETNTKPFPDIERPVYMIASFTAVEHPCQLNHKLKRGIEHGPFIPSQQKICIARINTDEPTNQRTEDRS
jgi:hypothetical protein